MSLLTEALAFQSDALRSEGETASWTHEGYTRSLPVFFIPGHGSAFDHRAEPDAPSLAARYSDFAGLLSEGDLFVIQGWKFEAVAPLIIDELTDHVTVSLRPLPDSYTPPVIIETGGGALAASGIETGGGA